MIDYFLRTSTKSNMEACLIAAGVATRNASSDIIGQWDGGRVDIDFIGKIYGIVNEESVVLDDRYHVNLRVCGDQLAQDQLDELPILDPAPTTPMRVFA
jgi:hypothetical protein